MSEQFKYLAVRNWGKYQGQIGSKGDIRRPFIKTASTLDSDPDFAQLRVSQRYILEGCRRLVAVHGQNLHNNPAWVARALCLHPKDTAQVPHSIRTLTELGFLIPTNQRDPFSQESNETIRNDTNVTKTAKSRGASTQDRQTTGSPDDSFSPGVYQICDECGKPTSKCECVELPKSKAFEIED